MDIARGIALRPDGVSGYVLDGSGGIHPFGGAPPFLTATYWPGMDIARGIALRPDGSSGWVVDGWGGVHSVGGIPEIGLTGDLPGQDTARGIVATDSGGGYTLSASGRVHPFGDAPPVPDSTDFERPVARGLG
jgi:hypothetical protein